MKKIIMLIIVSTMMMVVNGCQMDDTKEYLPIPVASASGAPAIPTGPVVQKIFYVNGICGGGAETITANGGNWKYNFALIYRFDKNIDFSKCYWKIFKADAGILTDVSGSIVDVGNTLCGYPKEIYFFYHFTLPVGGSYIIQLTAVATDGGRTELPAIEVTIIP